MNIHGNLTFVEGKVKDDLNGLKRENDKECCHKAEQMKIFLVSSQTQM